MSLYTKNGRPLQVVDDKVYSKSGKIIGRIKGDIVYGTDGRYVGAIVGDCLVYRAAQSATTNAPFNAADRMGIVKANRVAAVILGDEPKIPD